MPQFIWAQHDVRDVITTWQLYQHTTTTERNIYSLPRTQPHARMHHSSRGSEKIKTVATVVLLGRVEGHDLGVDTVCKHFEVILQLSGHSSLVTTDSPLPLRLPPAQAHLSLLTRRGECTHKSQYMLTLYEQWQVYHVHSFSLTYV